MYHGKKEIFTEKQDEMTIFTFNDEDSSCKNCKVAKT